MENEETIEKLSILVDLMKCSTDALENFVAQTDLIKIAFHEVLEESKIINQNLQEAAQGLKALVDEATKADEVGPEPEGFEVDEAEQEPVDTFEEHVTSPEIREALMDQIEEEKVPVHKVDSHEIRFAVCGAMGTASQPFGAAKNDRISSVNDEVTCPGCLKIIAGKRILEKFEKYLQ